MPGAGRGRAIVVGAGIGGLCAAAVLARHADEVLVIERDVLPATAEPRDGVPQGRHVHALLLGGLRALERLFEGLGDGLAQAGAIPVSLGLDVRVEQPGYDPFPRRDLGARTYSLSRPLLEHVVRGRLARHANVAIRQGAHVRSLVGAQDGSAVTGVRLHGDRAIDEVIPAALVVDASGRGALTLDFLRGASHATPEESTIDVDVRYTCGMFEIDHGDADWCMLQTRPAPEVGRRAIMFRIEGGNRWIAGLGGIGGDSAPVTLEQYLDYARTLRTTTAHDVLRGARLVGELRRFALPRSYRRHLERIPSFPRGIVALGDAVCRINPSYGQGMTVAAKEAVLLAEVLDEGHAMEDAGRAFYARLPAILDDPWRVAEGDYMYPHLAHARPADYEARARFQAAVTRAAASDPDVHRQMIEVAHLAAPSSSLRAPAMTARIAAASG